MFIPRDPPPVDEWEYFKFSHHITFKLEPQEGLNGIVEPIMIVSISFTFLLCVSANGANKMLRGQPTDVCFPQVTNAERDGQRVFAVGDLLEPHPTDKDRWKVFGRVDDQIALSTGQKVGTSFLFAQLQVTQSTHPSRHRSTQCPTVCHIYTILKNRFRDVQLTSRREHRRTRPAHRVRARVREHACRARPARRARRGHQRRTWRRAEARGVQGPHLVRIAFSLSLLPLLTRS